MYRSAGRHAFGNQSKDTAQFRIRSCALLVCFGTLYPILFLGGGECDDICAFNWFLAPALYWLIT